MTLRITRLLPLLAVTALLTACETRPPARPAPVEPSERGTPALRVDTPVQNGGGADAVSGSPPSPRLLRVRRQASS